LNEKAKTITSKVKPLIYLYNNIDNLDMKLELSNYFSSVNNS